MTGKRVLWEEWSIRRNELRAEMPGLHSYLLVDAAQLPLNCMPWQEMLASGEVSNLLDAQPEASHPEVCALLVDEAAAWTDALVATHLARRPFAFMLLHSDRAQAALARRLARATVVKLPDGSKGLLRYYDAAVYQRLLQALPESRYVSLLSCARAWTWIGRNGRIQTVRSEKGNGWATAALALDFCDLEALHRHAAADRIAAQLKKNSRLPVDADPFDTYAKLELLIQQLHEAANAMPADALLYRCSALSIPHSLNSWRAMVPMLVKRHSHNTETLVNAMMDWGAGEMDDESKSESVLRKMV